MKRQFLILIAIAAFATAFPTNTFGKMGKAVKANIKFDFTLASAFIRRANIGLNQSAA